MYCTRLAGNVAPKKSPKNRRMGTIAQLCRAISSQLRHVSTIGKNWLSSNISSTCPHNMANFNILAAEIISLVWGTRANFNGFRVLAALLQRRRSTEANQTFHNVWPLPGLVDYIYIFGGCCSLVEFCKVQNSLCVLQVLRCYWQRYCTAVEQWARAKFCGVEHRAPAIFGRATITSGIGSRSS